MPIFASLMRAIRAEDGLRALLRSPRTSTALCSTGGKSRRSAAARPSTLFYLMNSSTSSLLGKPLLFQLHPPVRTSWILFRSSTEGSPWPLSLPQASTALLRVGELLLKAYAVSRLTPVASMKSSTCLELGKPTPLPMSQLPPLPPPLSMTLASRMRAKSAAEGFLALESSPRATTRL